jgi:hypothetical protein
MFVFIKRNYISSIQAYLKNHYAVQNPAIKATGLIEKWDYGITLKELLM